MASVEAPVTIMATAARPRDTTELLEYATSERGGIAGSSAAVIDGPEAGRGAGMKLCRGEDATLEAAHGGDAADRT